MNKWAYDGWNTDETSDYIRVAIDIIWADHTKNIQLLGGRFIPLFNLF